MADRTDPKDKIIKELNSEIKNWEHLFNSSETPMMILDCEFRIMKINDAMLSFLGKPLDQVIGKTCYEVIYQTRMSIESCPLEKMKKTKKREEIELYVPEKDKYLIISVDPSLDEKSNISQVIHSLRDITCLKRIQNELKVSEERFSQIAENSREWIWEVDRDGLYTFSSPMVQSILGYSPEETVGKKHFYDFFHPETRNEQKKAAFDIFAKKEAFRQFQNKNVHKDGNNIVWLLTSGIPLLDKKGDLIGYRGADMDITSYRKTEEALRESESRIRSIFHVAPIGIGVVNPSDRVLMDVNEYLCKMIGYSRSELIGKNARILYPSDEDYEFVGREKYKQIKEKGVGSVETRWKKKDGTVIRIVLSSTPIDKNNIPLGVIFTALDITESKLSEEKIIASEKKYHQLYEGSQDGYVMVDMRGNIQECNKRYRSMLGYTEQELKKLTYKDLTPLKWHGFEQDIVEKSVIPKGHSAIYEKEYIKKDGKVFPVELRTYLIVDSQGQPQGMWAFVRDRSQRRDIESEIISGEQKFRKMFNSMKNGIAIYEVKDNGNDFIIKDINPAGERISKVKKQEVIGCSVLEKFPGAREMGLLDIFKEVFKSGQPKLLPTSLYQDDRISQWVENYVLKLPTGEIVQVYDDKTEQKQYEAELEQKIKDMERFHKVAVGRELKMVELKKEIATLKAQSETQKNTE